MKRILCVLLIMVMLFSTITISASESAPITVTLDATSYTTDGILIPNFTAPEDSGYS